MSLYTLLILFIFFGPFLISLWPRLGFWRQWQSLWAVFILVSLPFIFWDIIMTNQGAWGFTAQFAGTIKIWSLPIGEWLFFLVVPFVCLVMYQLLEYVDQKHSPNSHQPPKLDQGGMNQSIHKHFSIPNQEADKPIVLISFKTKFRNFLELSCNEPHRKVLFVLTVLCILLAVISTSQLYSLTVWLALSLALFLTLLLNPHLLIKKIFWLYLLLSFAGFLVLNSILTSLPIVWYNPEAFSNWRIGSIPVEDFVYNGALLICSLLVWLRWRKI